LAAAVLAVGLPFLGGCKGNSAPLAKVEAGPPPPVLRVLPAAGDPLTANPFSDVTWRNAVWETLGPALHDARTPPLTRVASLYDSKNLYVAFLCASPRAADAVASAPATGSDAPNMMQDRAEIWLDTSTAQNGTEVFSAIVTSAGQVQGTWYRASAPPEPKEDGAPSFLYPISEIPDYKVPGMDARISHGTLDGQTAWGAVVAIPLQSLPLPLRIDAAQVKAGAHWRVNLIRADIVQRSDLSNEVRQANFAPVYPACQQVSPYRMAQLLLESPNASIALSPGN
jgi:hypothetical protein